MTHIVNITSIIRDICLQYVTDAVKDKYNASRDIDDPAKNHFYIKLHLITPKFMTRVMIDDYFVDHFNTMWFNTSDPTNELIQKITHMMELSGMSHTSCAILFLYDISSELLSRILHLINKSNGIIASDIDMYDFIDKCALVWFDKLYDEIITDTYNCNDTCKPCLDNTFNLFERYYEVSDDSSCDSSDDSSE